MDSIVGELWVDEVHYEGDTIYIDEENFISWLDDLVAPNKRRTINHPGRNETCYGKVRITVEWLD